MPGIPARLLVPTAARFSCRARPDRKGTTSLASDRHRVAVIPCQGSRDFPYIRFCARKPQVAHLRKFWRTRPRCDGSQPGQVSRRGPDVRMPGIWRGAGDGVIRQPLRVGSRPDARNLHLARAEPGVRMPGIPTASCRRLGARRVISARSAVGLSAGADRSGPADGAGPVHKGRRPGASGR